MPLPPLLTSVLTLLLFAPMARAEDVVTLANGGRLSGTILREDDTSVVLKVGAGTMTFPRVKIAQIERAPAMAAQTQPITPVPSKKLPTWDTVLTAIAKDTDNGIGLHQIPATVIDVGIMRHVPYSSYRCGPSQAIEINIYGDPGDPICYEIGLYPPHTANAKLKDWALGFMARTVLSRSLDIAIVTSMDRQQDSVVHDPLTIETTPPEAEDSYGAWWIAVYDKSRVDAARAKPEETAAITTSLQPEITTMLKAVDDPYAWSTDELRQARRPTEVTSGMTSGFSGGRTSSAPTRSTGGRVYVRGYTRKDGTYVAPHTRRR